MACAKPSVLRHPRRYRGGDMAALRPPVPSSAAASAVMRGNRRRDTRPELAVRSALHRRGLRFRVDVPVLKDRRRRVDIVLSGPRVALFIDGCFWHGCPSHGSQPVANSDYWSRKLAGNVARDRDTDARLRREGWRVIRVWEHEDPDAAAAAIERVVRGEASPVRDY